METATGAVQRKRVQEASNASYEAVKNALRKRFEPESQRDLYAEFR